MQHCTLTVLLRFHVSSHHGRVSYDRPQVKWSYKKKSKKQRGTRKLSEVLVLSMPAITVMASRVTTYIQRHTLTMHVWMCINYTSVKLVRILWGRSALLRGEKENIGCVLRELSSFLECGPSSGLQGWTTKWPQPPWIAHVWLDLEVVYFQLLLRSPKTKLP